MLRTCANFWASFLDPGVQAKLLKLLLNLQERRGLRMLFFTHDLALVRKVSDRMAIMLDGKIIEQGPSNIVVTAPVHSYTISLVKTALALHSESEAGEAVKQPSTEAHSGMTIGWIWKATPSTGNCLSVA